MATSTATKQFDSEELLLSLPNASGVYRMLDEAGRVLYVGKARNLKSRVTSYFRSKGLATKTMALMNKTFDIQVTVVASETEALLLEQSFIKSERPPYNVILRDDKSYPYIRFSVHEYPRISLHRGARNDGAVYFGPYPSAKAVRDSISILQRIFRIRPCEDTFFKNRSRPCLQYQIKRCSGPCVRAVTPELYADDLKLASLFLKGKNTDLLNQFKQRMNHASESLEFEKAAVLRDQIHHLVKVQEAQNVYRSSGTVDVFGIATNSSDVCIQGMFIREGRLLGHRTWYAKNELGRAEGVVLSEFVTQYYVGSERDLPREVLTSVEMADAQLLQQMLEERSGRKVEIATQTRTHRAQWIRMVQENASVSLTAYASKRASVFQRFIDLQDRLDLEDVPQRLECFDISHSSGEETVASCVVFDTAGPRKSDYRRFNIRDVEKGDDYAALAQAVRRHYERLRKEESNLPDLLIIDGGKGQVARVKAELRELQLDMPILGISKGPGRRAGLETIWLDDKSIADIPPSSGAMFLLQSVRDEAHRFAITGHRTRRQKQRRRSELDHIDGIGPRRKRELLTHFGTVTAVKGAPIEELAKVPGISQKMARTIYEVFHDV